MPNSAKQNQPVRPSKTHPSSKVTTRCTFPDTCSYGWQFSPFGGHPRSRFLCHLCMEATTTSVASLDKIFEFSWWQHHLTWKETSQGYTTTKQDCRAQLPIHHQGQAHTGTMENQELVPHPSQLSQLWHLSSTVCSSTARGNEFLVPKECNTAHTNYTASRDEATGYEPTQGFLYKEQPASRHHIPRHSR